MLGRWVVCPIDPASKRIHYIEDCRIFELARPKLWGKYNHCHCKSPNLVYLATHALNLLCCLHYYTACVPAPRPATSSRPRHCYVALDSVCTLCCKCLGSFAFLWCKMPTLLCEMAVEIIGKSFVTFVYSTFL